MLATVIYFMNFTIKFFINNLPSFKKNITDNLDWIYNNTDLTIYHIIIAPNKHFNINMKDFNLNRLMVNNTIKEI